MDENQEIITAYSHSFSKEIFLKGQSELTEKAYFNF